MTTHDRMNRQGSSSTSATRLSRKKPQHAAILQRLGEDPQRVGAADIQHLQRTIGNQATIGVLQAKFNTGTNSEGHTDASSNASIQRTAQPDSNKTGLPQGLKSGVERLSGLAMDDVKVHYNSNKPANYNSRAYTEGTDIHVGAGQESVLPHEAWHVVQQKQGRVQSSMQFKGIGANIDSGLEHEADVMGSKAQSLESRLPSAAQAQASGQRFGQAGLAQRQVAGAPVRQFACGGKKGGGQATAALAIDDIDVDGVDNEEIVKYTELKRRKDHYAGEEVDASTNPMIADGRKGVAQLRKQGLSDDQIKGYIKGMLPSYTDTDIETYLMGDTTPQVEYLDSNDRQDYELTVSGGKLKQNGVPFDTTGMFSSGAGAGYSIFVMSPGGQIYANEHKPGLFHHSSFLAGLPTAAAGELQVKRGVLKHVTNKSGHYHPGAAQMFQVLQEIKDRGIGLSTFALKISIPPDAPGAEYAGDYKKARAFYDRYAAQAG